MICDWKYIIFILPFHIDWLYIASYISEASVSNRAPGSTSALSHARALGVVSAAWPTLCIVSHNSSIENYYSYYISSLGRMKKTGNCIDKSLPSDW